MSDTRSSSGTTLQDGKSPVSSTGDDSPLFPGPAGGTSPLFPEPATATLQADKERQENAWRADLARLEYEIETLRTVLVVKNNQVAELKRRLGITPMTEMKQDLQQSIQTIKESDAYQKTGTAFRNFGDWSSRKLSDMRNSTAFKSVEEKVGGAYQSVKTSQSIGNLRSRLTRSASGRTDDAGAGSDQDGAASTPGNAAAEPNVVVNPSASVASTPSDEDHHAKSDTH